MVESWYDENSAESKIDQIAYWVGSPTAIVLATLSLILFLTCGIVFEFSDTYQIIGNTFMSAVSYMTMFVVQHTQNTQHREFQQRFENIMKELEDLKSKIVNQNGPSPSGSKD